MIRCSHPPFAAWAETARQIIANVTHWGRAPTIETTRMSGVEGLDHAADVVNFFSRQFGMHRQCQRLRSQFFADWKIAGFMPQERIAGLEMQRDRVVYLGPDAMVLQMRL